MVAYAIAGNVTVDLMTEPLGVGKRPAGTCLGDIWPTSDETTRCKKFAMPKARQFRGDYAHVAGNPASWENKVPGVQGDLQLASQHLHPSRPSSGLHGS